MLKCYASASCAPSTRLAEGVRFELTRPFGLPVFKTGAFNRSATPPDRMNLREVCHCSRVEQGAAIVWPTTQFSAFDLRLPIRQTTSAQRIPSTAAQITSDK